MRPALSEAVVPLAQEDPVAAVLDAHDRGVLLQLSTSGSVGHPRTVRRTTSSWVDSFPTVARLTGLTSRSRVWVPGPLSGTMNLFAAVLARSLGAHLAFAPQDATHAHVTPSDARRLLDHPALPDELHVTVAGDRLDRALRDELVARGVAVAHYYGAAELSFVAWGSHADDLEAFPGVDVRERHGVLWVRSPYLAQMPTDADGWATVGDRGTVLPDGRVVVRGRGDAAVLTGGATVLVEDVEAALRPAARCDLVVVGVPHRDLGEVVAAVLTRDDGVAAARERARSELSESHRPRLWFVADSLPVTPGGKPDRSEVRSLAVSGALRRVSPLGAT